MEQVLASFGGAHARRVIDRASARVPEHAHDWPVLSIFVLGGYRNSTELGDAEIAGPSAVLYRPRAAHANAVGDDGFEQIEIEFDPDWAGLAAGPPVARWTAGPGAAAARTLARACAAGVTEAELRGAVRRFVANTAGPRDVPQPAWVRRGEAMLRADPHLGVADLAERLGRHPAWLGCAYARHTGESLPQAAARLRVERAARLLRETDEAPAGIAAAAGFCDQSHMIRVFRRLLGRAPSAVRADRAGMRASAPR